MLDIGGKLANIHKLPSFSVKISLPFHYSSNNGFMIGVDSNFSALNIVSEMFNSSENCQKFSPEGAVFGLSLRELRTKEGNRLHNIPYALLQYGTDGRTRGITS